MIFGAMMARDEVASLRPDRPLATTRPNHPQRVRLFSLGFISCGACVSNGGQGEGKVTERKREKEEKGGQLVV